MRAVFGEKKLWPVGGGTHKCAASEARTGGAEENVAAIDMGRGVSLTWRWKCNKLGAEHRFLGATPGWLRISSVA